MAHWSSRGEGLIGFRWRCVLLNLAPTGGGCGGVDRLSEDDGSVEVAIVDLVTARAAEQLSSIDVHRDLVAGEGERVIRRVGVKKGRVTEHRGAGDARVQSRTGRLLARAAPWDLGGFPPYGGATAGRLDAYAVLQGAKRLGAVTRTEVEEVGTWLRRDVAADLGRHGGGGR
ncbi:hypothetical protein V6N13_107599 [Hibiscus sabdariffa]|uniref:Uncharacterized protein n=1 Tax=Hibiscus sabdariffa TaxID=183260 RepID=A0ABR2SPN8_9ROSI